MDLSPGTTRYVVIFSLLCNFCFLFSIFDVFPLSSPSSASIVVTEKHTSIKIVPPNNYTGNVSIYGQHVHMAKTDGTETDGKVNSLSSSSPITKERTSITNTPTNNNHTGNNNDIIYGHVHMAKTAGTTINGRLAHEFERVCGHKGYSYDYYQLNERAKDFAAQNNGTISVNRLKDSLSGQKGYNRGRVPMNVMSEIGYENCDYVSHESGWSFWAHTFQWATTLELHVPCRDPFSHLMSQCHYYGTWRFNCTNPDLAKEIVGKCVKQAARFSLQLQNVKNIDLRCFNPIPVDKYISYMGERLQKKRRPQHPFIQRETNKPRHKDEECLWKSSEEFQQSIHDALLAHDDYYKFCNKCMGSEKELILE